MFCFLSNSGGNSNSVKSSIMVILTAKKNQHYIMTTANQPDARVSMK